MAKGHLSVIKGSYLESGSVDRTLPMATGQDASIVRGSILKVVNDEFTRTVAGDKPAINAEYYVALADGTESAVGHAGALTGLSLQQNLEIETDQFTGAIASGADVTVDADGKFVAAAATDVVIGRASSAVYNRWINDAERTDHNGRAANGNNVNVIRISINPSRAIKA